MQKDTFYCAKSRISYAKTTCFSHRKNTVFKLFLNEKSCTNHQIPSYTTVIQQLTLAHELQAYFRPHAFNFRINDSESVIVNQKETKTEISET